MSVEYIDGRPYNPPENPLLEKWAEKYPKVPMPQASQVCDGYSCMWCGRCPDGSYWKVPEEDMGIYNKWQEELEEYHRVNGDMVALRITSWLTESAIEMIKEGDYV